VSDPKKPAPRMNSLIAGNLRFQAGKFLVERDRFIDLLRGQSPRALYIGCADSRVVPNFIIDAGPGEVFVVRNVGAVVPRVDDPASAVIASAVEYAVFTLHVKHVVVCGHDRCGAIHAITEGLDASSHVGGWLSRATSTLPPRLLADLKSVSEPMLVERFVRAQYVNLTTYPVMQRALAEGKSVLHAWVYDPETGRIREMGDDGTFHEVMPEHVSDDWNVW
jgi:carbonic anhydrase